MLFRSYTLSLTSAYELAEVAVAPAFQSFGIGRALIERLIAGVPERTCVLSTRSDSNAHRLYRRLGFVELAEMQFFAGGHPFYIMGRLLPPAGDGTAPPGVHRDRNANSLAIG